MTKEEKEKQDLGRDQTEKTIWLDSKIEGARLVSCTYFVWEY